MRKQKGTSSGDKIRNFIEADRVKDRLIDRVSYASDAGFYQLIPEAVVHAKGEEEISALLRFCKENKTPLVFRAGGSSLSGQSITDGILCNLSQHWKMCKPEQNGQFVRVQPGITGAMVNARLKPFSRKIGPDPSSISAAMMGGILSNNASGMCCGVANNCYHTTKFIKFILPDGKTYSTE
jgi:D-lactate dehydrogenase